MSTAPTTPLRSGGVRALDAAISAKEARRRFDRRRLFASGRREGEVELVFMPFVLVTLELVEGDQGVTVQVLVDGRSGGAVRLAGEVAWRPGVPLLAGPTISESEAVSRARALVQRGLLLQRRVAVGRLSLGVLSAELVAYPFWMQVFERRRGRYDIRLLDGVGGRRAGAEVKRGVLSALADEARRGAEEPVPGLDRRVSR